ncbi:MAG: condensation domain protein, partial [Proteobacteria bacterium]
MTVLTRTPDDHVLLFSTHHINGDLFSIAQFMEELFVLYAAA